MEPAELENLLREAAPEHAAALVDAMEPDEAADALLDLTAGERETLLMRMPKKVQAMAAMLAGVVAPVGSSGTAPGADEGAVDQDHLPALLGDLLQGAVQPRRLGGEQSDQLVPPAADGGLGYVVAAGHVGQALVVAQHGQDDHRDLPRQQDPPPGANRLQMASEQLGEVADGARGQRQTALVDRRVGVLGSLFFVRHTIPTAHCKHPGYARAEPFRMMAFQVTGGW
ncbi:hypothetical protein OG749_05345 [Streptomyces nojiriensis]|uniref:magnesium transporter MgtE N-terminal domain-containing protein n=1 Tax=Streptomyces nojiriensis TaxID=66374 RepID=UPI002E178BB6